MASPSSTSKSPSHAPLETVARNEAVKFTPGPWMVSNVYEPDMGVVGGGDGRGKCVQVVADTAFGLDDDECRANARLIAAAPEMLAALQKLKSASILLMASGVNKKLKDRADEAIAEALDQARAAISKAVSIEPPSSDAHGVVESEPMKVKP